MDFNRTFPGDWSLQPVRVIADGLRGCAEITFRVSNQTMPAIAFFEFEDGLIARITDYWPDSYEPPARVSQFVERLEFYKRWEVDEYATNWKVCAENFLECYHCAIAHPSLAKAIDVSQDAYALTTGRWHSLQVGPPMPKSTTSRRSHRSTIARTPACPMSERWVAASSTSPGAMSPRA